MKRDVALLVRCSTALSWPGDGRDDGRGLRKMDTAHVLGGDRPKAMVGGCPQVWTLECAKTEDPTFVLTPHVVTCTSLDYRRF